MTLQYLWEEINKISSNESNINFGWKIMEGNHCYETEVCDQDGLTKPIFEYPSDASYAFSLMNINQKMYTDVLLREDTFIWE